MQVPGIRICSTSDDMSEVVKYSERETKHAVSGLSSSSYKTTDTMGLPHSLIPHQYQIVRPEVNVRDLSQSLSTLLLRQKSLTKPGTHPFDLKGCSVSPSILLSLLPQGWDYKKVLSPAFLLGCRDPNSVLHPPRACIYQLGGVPSYKLTFSDYYLYRAFCLWDVTQSEQNHDMGVSICGRKKMGT